jgi:iron complex outermembrane recepter protein
MVRPVFLILIFCTFFGISGLAQFKVSGVVSDVENAVPLAGVTLVLHETGRGAYSDSTGKFVIAGVKKGTYHLHISAFGYEAETRNIRIDSADLAINIKLKATPVELKQVVLEGEYLKSDRAKQPLSIDIADGEFLEKNSGATLSESLEKIPGITSLNTGVGISKPVIRGMSFNRIIVNENGIKQQGQQWGLDHGLEIDQSGIGQIEIVKGPVSYIYGSDGMGGVMNIRPLPPPRAEAVSGEISSFFKSVNNNVGLTGSIAFRKKNAWARVRYASQDYGDYKIPADSFRYLGFVLPVIDNKLKNTAGVVRTGSAAAGILSSWGKVSLTVSDFYQKAGFFQGAIGIPNTFSLRKDDSDRNIALPSQEINHLKTVLNSEIFFGNNWLETDLSYQYNLRQELSFPHAHGVVPGVSGNVAHRWDLKTFTLNSRYNISLSDSLNLITGISFENQSNRKSGFEYLLPDFDTWNGGAFSVIKYDRSERLSLNIGIRADLAAITIQEFRDISSPISGGASGDVITPFISNKYFNWSGGAGASYFITEKTNFKLNIGKSYRLPSAPELSMNGVHHGTFRHEQGDTNLEPESGWQADVSFDYSAKDFVFRTSPFFNYFNNYIFLRPTVEFSPLPDGGQIYRYSQTRAVYSGFEMSGEYHPLQYLHLEAGAEYVYTYNIDADLPLPFIPPFALTTEAELSRKRIFRFLRNSTGAVQFSYYAAQNRTDRNELQTSGYALVNLSAGTTFHLGGHNVELIFRINNLLNTKYYKHLSRYRLLNLPEPGRNFTVMLKIPLMINLASDKRVTGKD